MSAYPHIAGPSLESDPALAQLLEQLRVSHNDAICSTLIYGSCLRSGDIYDGLLDLYLICDSYRDAYHRPLLSVANWVLPPNVFYAELKTGDKQTEAVRVPAVLVERQSTAPLARARDNELPGSA